MQLLPQPSDPFHHLSFFLCRHGASKKTSDEQWQMLVQWLQQAKYADSISKYRIQDCYPGTQTYKVSIYLRNAIHVLHIDMKEMTEDLAAVMYVHES